MVREWPDTRHVYYGTAAERAAFPAAGEAAGALFFDYDDEKYYKWNGAAWVEVGALIAHTHAAGDGGQLDWDVIWIDAAHDHSAVGEGGQNLHAITELEFEDPTELTIVGGAITRTQVYHTIVPETGASDILTTINGGSIGDKLIIRPKLNTILHVQSDIVNIHLSYVGFDYEMNNVGNNADHLELVFDGNVWAGGGAVDPIPSGVDPTEHSHSKLVASDGNPDPAQSNDAAGNMTGVGWLASDAHAFKIKNTSGGAATANDVGYIDENGEYKTTTTAYSDVAWCVVVTGGANNADIYVARRGRVTVVLNGNCSAGDYLYTSTTAGQAQPQAYMRPEVFAVALTANAGGAGGTCSALLLCNRRLFSVVSANDFLRVNSSSDSNWKSTCNGAPAGAVVTYNTPVTGNENAIVPAATTQLGKLVLWNTSKTPDQYALISSVDTGANTITVTAAADVAAWLNGENIQVESTTTVIGSGREVFDVQVTSAVPELATHLLLDTNAVDTAGGEVATHPYEAFASGAYVACPSQPNGDRRTTIQKLIQRRVGYVCDATGAGTMTALLRLTGVWVAEP